MPDRSKISLTECPRDAMQGWKNFIPTEKKITYLNALLKVGFDTIDFGSFVSPKAIPQMADTAEVLKGLQVDKDGSKLLAIIANERGAKEAVAFDEISCLGFPFSVSETFQQKNSNSGIAVAMERLMAIQNICIKNKKQLVVYISMGFGNPYGDVYSEEIVFDWVNKIAAMDVRIISLADTVGLATAEQVRAITKYLIDSLSQTDIGVHLHSAKSDSKVKIDAALEAGCRRFDSAIKGIGGCPMAGNELIGNIDTEWLVNYLDALNLCGNLNINELENCSRIATEIFI